MAEEYMRLGEVSEKTDAYAFGVVLLELLMGMPHQQIVTLVFHDERFFTTIGRHSDARAGAWPRGAVKGLAGVAQKCLEYRARARTTVRAVLPKLEALTRKYCR